MIIQRWKNEECDRQFTAGIIVITGFFKSLFYILKMVIMNIYIFGNENPKKQFYNIVWKI